MRIVSTLTEQMALTSTTPEQERQAQRERQAAEHARAITSMMDEIPRRELSFEALSGRVIEHVASADGAYYRPFQGDPAFTGDDVTKYYVSQDGLVIMLERCTNPSSRLELERIRARKEQRRVEQAAAAKALWKERRKALR